MSSTQSQLLVIRPSRKTILGGLACGGFVDFDGTETTFVLPHGETVNVAKWYPDNMRGNKREWVMAYLVDERNFREGEYSNFADFTSINDMAPTVIFSSPATIPNIVRFVPGTVLDIMNVPDDNNGSAVLKGGTKATFDTYSRPFVDQEATTPFKLVVGTPNPVTGAAVTRNAATNLILTTISQGTPATAVLKDGAIPSGLALAIVSQTIRLQGTTSAAAGAFSFTMTVTATDGRFVDIPVAGTLAD